MHSGRNKCEISETKTKKIKHKVMVPFLNPDYEHISDTARIEYLIVNPDINAILHSCVVVQVVCLFD